MEKIKQLKEMHDLRDRDRNSSEKIEIRDGNDDRDRYHNIDRTERSRERDYHRYHDKDRHRDRERDRYCDRDRHRHHDRERHRHNHERRSYQK